jgi:hypothetical protein
MNAAYIYPAKVAVHPKRWACGCWHGSRIVFTAEARAFDEPDQPVLNVTTNLVFN